MNRAMEGFFFSFSQVACLQLCLQTHTTHYNNRIQLTCTLQITLIPLTSHKDGNRHCIVLW